MRKLAIFLIALVFLHASHALAGNCAPAQMLHIVISTRAEGQPSDAFITKPKTLYRLGNKYGRVEEAVDPERNLHLLFVVSEPDVWVVNLADRSGHHMVDSGPSLNFRAPTLQAIKSDQWNEFEFGCEEEAFMTSRGVKPTADARGTSRMSTRTEA